MFEENFILIGHPFSLKNIYVEKHSNLVIIRRTSEQWRNLPGNHRLTLNCNRWAATANLLGMCFEMVPRFLDGISVLDGITVLMWYQGFKVVPSFEMALKF